MVINYSEDEDRDGVQFNWNLFPSTRLEASQLSTPLGCLYQPLRSTSTCITGPPVVCSTCKNFISPFSRIDQTINMWWCSMCGKKSFLPDHFVAPSEGQQCPSQLKINSSNIAYELPEDIDNKVSAGLPFTYVFVIDVYKHIDELEEDGFTSLIDSIIQSIERIPNGSLIGLVTFEESVHVHQWGSSETFSFDKEFLSKSISKKSKKPDYNAIWTSSVSDAVIEKIGLSKNSLSFDHKSSPLVKHNILQELNESSKSRIISQVKGLKPKICNSYKPSRSSGLAHYITTILLSSYSFKDFIGKVIFATSGPGTNFPGIIVNPEQKEIIRSHADIEKLNAPNFLSSSKFYQTLGYIASGQTLERSWSIASSASVKTTDYDINPSSPKWSVDIFTGSLDQTGIYEMRAVSTHTMGKIYLSDSFKSNQFKKSFISAIDITKSSYRNILTISTSQNLKISRFITTGGYALPSSYTKRGEKYFASYHEKISDTLTKFDSAIQKKNFTNRWQFNTLLKDDTIALFLEMNTARSSKDITTNDTKEVFIQFQLKYWDFTKGKWILKVTTVQRPTTVSIILQKSDILREREILLSFNQRCWTILLARLLIQKIDTTLGFGEFDNLIELMDEVLIKLLYHFGGLSLKVNSSSADRSNPYLILQQIYEINENFKDLPSYIYNLRRNPQLIRIFNSSPDETAYYHSWFLRMNGDISINAIQPKLYKLINDSEEEIPLNSNCLSLPPRTFLLMNTVFQIIIYYIRDAEASKLDLHHSQNDHLVETRDNSILPALTFIESHMTKYNSFIPKYIVTQTNHSQSRFLIARLNPIEKDEPKFSQANVDNKINEGGIFRFFKKKDKKNNSTISYDLLMTDDMSLKQYYDILVRAIKVYKVGSE
ncbi:ScSEC23 cytoplasmic GTPase-activating protein-like protein [Scheffersomyces amazonensis]|uniref:ScSEC23 cytoplasmic GTPase-activating protein-like protein n=1 Tax=Scheffersomyces amazonensis TaxID=1078765 RepID=UPI00315C8689